MMKKILTSRVLIVCDTRNFIIYTNLELKVFLNFQSWVNLYAFHVNATTRTPRWLLLTKKLQGQL